MHGMKLGWGWSVALVLACGGGGGGSDGQTDSNSGTETQSGTTQGSGPTESSQGEASQTGTTTGIGGMSDSQTDTTAGPTGETTMGALTTTDPTLTTGTSVTTLETTETPDDTSTSSSEGDTGTSADSTGSGESEGTTDGTSGTTEVCVPVTEVCNDVDDDCDGQIDDVDVGMDGICDCLSIALVGNQGANNSSQFVAYLQSKGTSVERINSNVLNDIDAPLTPAVLAKYDIIILDWLQRTYTAQESADVRAWIEAGGGLMTMTGHTNNQVTIDRCNSFISPLGLTYNGGAGFFSGPVTQFAMHPITEGLTSITFLGGLYIDIVEDGIGMNEVIMTLPPGPVGVVQERVDGRVFVFGDEWVEFDSEWSQMPEIQQFWVQTLSWLGPQDSCVVPQ